MARDSALIRFIQCTQDGPTPDAIKVGSSFLDAIKKNASTSYCIRHIFVLTQEQGKSVVEGVKVGGLAAFLRMHSVNFAIRCLSEQF